MGFQQPTECNAQASANLIEDTLLRCNLLLNKCRGQCYDGASVMKGHNKGVAKRIMEKQPKVIYMHCTAHSLSLALQVASHSTSIFRDTFDLIKDIVTFIKMSPKRNR